MFFTLITSMFLITLPFAEADTKTGCFGEHIKLECKPNRLLIINDVFHGRSPDMTTCTDRLCDNSESDCGSWKSIRNQYYRTCIGQGSCPRMVQRSEQFPCRADRVHSCYAHILYSCVSGSQVIQPPKAVTSGTLKYIKLVCNGNSQQCHWVITKSGSTDLRIYVVGPRHNGIECTSFSILDGCSVETISCQGYVPDEVDREDVQFQTIQAKVVIASMTNSSLQNYSIWIKLEGPRFKVKYFGNSFTDKLTCTSSSEDDGPVIGTVVGVVLVAVLIIVIAVFIIFRRRRKLSKQENKYSDVNDGKTDTGRSHDELQTESPANEHSQQGSTDPSKGYKISVPADYSYTQILKVTGDDTTNEAKAFAIQEGGESSDSYSVAKSASDADYSLAQPTDLVKPRPDVEQDHYGYSHMPGIEKRPSLDNENYGTLVDNAHTDYNGYSHMGDKFMKTGDDDSSHYQRAKNIDHDNYGYSHMPK